MWSVSLYFLRSVINVVTLDCLRPVFNVVTLDCLRPVINVVSACLWIVFALWLMWSVSLDCLFFHSIFSNVDLPSSRGNIMFLSCADNSDIYLFVVVTSCSCVGMITPPRTCTFILFNGALKSCVLPLERVSTPVSISYQIPAGTYAVTMVTPYNIK
jgi:hypothetical protein